MSEFKPGLEGVVAFETEIAEPDRDGGALRYRGVDIEDLVGRVPFEQVWGLLVDDEPEPGLSPREPYAAERPDRRRARRPAGRHRAPLRRVGARQADRHLRRAGAGRPGAALGDDDLDRRAVGPRRRRRDDPGRPGARRERRHRRRAVPARVARRGRSEARAGDRHVLDLHRRARAQRLHLHRPRRRLDRRRLRRRALVGRRRALRPAARRRAGAGAADARRRRGGRLDRAATSTTCSTAASG